MSGRQASAAIQQLPRSGIRLVFDEASKYPDCIRLEVGEPSFPTPAHIKQAAAEAMAADFTRYTPNAGIADLREALVDKLARRNGITAAPDDVIVTNGAVASIYTSLAGLVNPGDEVLLSDPSWPNYLQMTVLLQAKAVYYPLRLEHDLVPTADDIESRITSRTKVLLLNSPGNPSGAVIPEARMREILEVARRHDLWVISDEVYDEIYFDQPPVSLRPLDTDERVISVFSFSKTYAMTGWRVGYMVGPPEIVRHILRAQEPTTSCVNAMAQKAAVAAIHGDQTCVAEMRNAYADRCALVTGILDDHGVALLASHWRVLHDDRHQPIGHVRRRVRVTPDQRASRGDRARLRVRARLGQLRARLAGRQQRRSPGRHHSCRRSDQRVGRHRQTGTGTRTGTG